MQFGEWTLFKKFKKKKKKKKNEIWAQSDNENKENEFEFVYIGLKWACDLSKVTGPIEMSTNLQLSKFKKSQLDFNFSECY
jgi:hypothetical protein